MTSSITEMSSSTSRFVDDGGGDGDIPEDDPRHQTYDLHNLRHRRRLSSISDTSQVTANNSELTLTTSWSDRCRPCRTFSIATIRTPNRTIFTSSNSKHHKKAFCQFQRNFFCSSVATFSVCVFFLVVVSIANCDSEQLAHHSHNSHNHHHPHHPHHNSHKPLRQSYDSRHRHNYPIHYSNQPTTFLANVSFSSSSSSSSQTGGAIYGSSDLRTERQFVHNGDDTSLVIDSAVSAETINEIADNSVSGESEWPGHTHHPSHLFPTSHHHHSRHKLKHHRKRNNADFLPIGKSPAADSSSSSAAESAAAAASNVAPSHLARTYITTNKSINFTHIELDPITGNVYVGAANWIYQLNSDTLRVEHAVRTGPIRDNVACAPADCSGVDSNLAHLTNNVNKVLLLEPYARMLIVCGSVHQGACARHRLEDISLHEELIPLPVAANDENSSTIAFVGPARYFGVQLTPIFYVAATDSRLGPYRDMVPAISGRSLEPGSKLFNIIERSFADSARIDISSHLRDYFLVRYVYGFYSGDYVYFAQVQRRSYLRALEESGYVTRLARVCVSDAGFHTYTEMTLECVNEAGSRANLRPGSNSDRTSSSSRRPSSWQSKQHPRHNNQADQGGDETEEFNLLQDAYLIKAGADLADSLHIERGAQVLVGVFSASYDHTLRPGSKSALCMFPMAEIEQRFAENIHLCYNGSVYSRNMDYIAGSVNQCPDSGTGNVFNFCNEAVKLNGSIAARAQAAIVYRGGTVLTAVTASVTGQHTVAFVGTSYGSVKKILLQRGDYGEQFDEVLVDSGHPILADLFVDSDHNPKHLIAASPYKVVKLPVESCAQSDTCDQCLQARNPYCGWCSLQKRCTIKSECLNQPMSPGGASSSSSSSLAPNSGHYGPYSSHHRSHNPHSGAGSASASNLFSTPRWLSLETAQCIDFQAIKPEFMPRDLLAPVELIINQLPPLPYGANYLCVFERSSPIPGTVTRHGLTCQTPSLVSRPSLPDGQDHVNVNLAVRSSETDTDFIHRSFIFFDCSVHKSCKSCVMSSWNCNWCMHENLCTYNTSVCTRRVIVGENSPQNSLIKGVQHCPSFSIDQEILIPNGARRELRVEVRNLIPSQDGFQCIIEIEQAKERISARIRDNNIICQEIPISYQDEIGRQNASLTVLWNGDTFIDRTNFTIYKCQYLGSHAARADCSLCQTLDTKYGCVWCLNQCAFVDQCTEMPVSSCPPPRIDYIHPISGPVEGGTLVSIEGSNLGSSMDEIQDSVSIGGIPCHPIEYNVSIRVICRTGPSPIGPQSALVVIGNRAGVTRAQEKFQYKTIELNDVSPKIGPQSGGSRIYLSGNNLNIGSNVALFLDNLPCHVERALASSSQLSCRTSAAPYPSYVVSRLLLSIDGSNYTLLNPFLYTADPTIVRIEPLQSFFSGGRHLYVTGSQFSSIQQPRLLVFARRTRSAQHNLRHGATAWPPYATRSSTMSLHGPSFLALDGRPYGLGESSTTVATVGAYGLDTGRLINDSICTVLSPIKMVCPAPMINHDLRTLAIKLRHSELSAADLAAANSGNNQSSMSAVPIHIPDQIYLQIGFSMDDTLSVLELDTYYPHLDSNILYVSDPVVYSLSNGQGQSISTSRIGLREGDDVLPFKGDLLAIEGDNLAVLPLADTELNVTVGVFRCNLTSVSMRQIVCQPPTYPPPPTDELGRRSPIDLPAVILKIGNMRRHLGYLHYGQFYTAGFGYNGPNNNGHGYKMDSADGYNAQNGGSNSDDSTRFYHQNPTFGYGNRYDSGNGVLNVELLIGVLIFTGTILAIISVIVLAAYKHKTTEAEREFKRIQLQMDTLENNVRSECKQAFAELQTDILQASGLFSLEELHRMVVPAHDDRTFLLRMFFHNYNSLATKDGSTGGQFGQSYSGSSYYLSKDSLGIYDQGSIYRPLVYGQLSQLSNSANINQQAALRLSQLFWTCSPYFGLQLNSNEELPTIVAPPPAISDYHLSGGSNTYQQIGLNENYYTLSRSSLIQQQQQQQQQQDNNNRGYNAMIYHQPHQHHLSGNIYGGSVDGATSPRTLIEQFEQLLLNRSFLLNLVETLEQQKSFSIDDRTRFASLLMLALLDRMEYSFDVMRQLLARLVDRLAGSKHPSQLMRRPETVAEKMLADWLSICLCRYAKEVSGGPLFLLFSAIKHQIDKGPVDFVTGNSRYSLSEERLLREQIDYKSITVFVVVDEKLEQALPTILTSNTKNNGKLSTLADKSVGGQSGQQPCQQRKQQQRTANVNNGKPILTLRRQTGAGIDGSNSTLTTPKNVPNSEIGQDGSVTAGTVTTFTATTTTDELMTDGTSSAELTDKEFDQDYPAGVGGGGGGSGSTSGSGSSSSNCCQCRVLDCDTISQVKAKIIDTLYRSMPHSERPTIGDVQLYWRCLKPKMASANNGGSGPTLTTSSGESSSVTAKADNLDNKVEGPIAIKPTFPASMATASLLQEVYGVASMMSKADADRIYNASRRSDMSLLEMADLLLEDYDHSTQILTANEAIWRRLNTITHYGIQDGAQLLIGLRTQDLYQNGTKMSNLSTLYCGSRRPNPVQNSQDNLTTMMNESSTLNHRSVNNSVGTQRYNFVPNQPTNNNYEDEEQIQRHLRAEEVEDDDEDVDDEEANFHLYESIPAALNQHHRDSNYQHHHQMSAPSENYSITTTDRSREQSMLYGAVSNGMEAVYNLSNASNHQQQQSRSSRSNFYHLGPAQRNTYGIPSMMMVGPQHKHQDPANALALPLPPLPPMSQFMDPSVYRSTIRPQDCQEQLYDTSIGGARIGPSSPMAMMQTSPANAHNYSQRLLLQGQSPGSPPSITYRLQSHPSNISANSSNGRRQNSSSLARNFYERISSLVRGGSRRRRRGRQAHSRSSKSYNGLHVTGNNKHRFGQNRRLSSNDYAASEEDIDGAEKESEDDFDERHNIWHLVKPSSLIADCIIGASGSFLYDDLGEVANSRENRRNIRTIRQRRALRRPNRKPFVKSSQNSHQMASAAAAAAALSASQINLSQQNVTSSNNNNHTISLSYHHPSSIPNHCHRQMAAPGHGSLSFLTSSASSLFASLFNSGQANTGNAGVNGSSLPQANSALSANSRSNSSSFLLHRSIPEIYLTRLLSTKGTIQQYVDDFFGTIFSVNERLPIAVKWLFDFFDNVAMKNSINDTDIVHLWKSNSFVLRFWITLLRSPEMLFDVGSNVSIDVCLDVLANNLTDACLATGLSTSATGLESSTLPQSHHHLGKESPSSKLLFARDIPAYQQMIGQYYKDIAMLPSIKESDIMAYMKDVSKTYEGKVRKERTISELLSYCLQHKDAIFSSLAADSATQQEHFHLKFESIAYAALAANLQSQQQQFYTTRPRESQGSQGQQPQSQQQFGPNQTLSNGSRV